MKKIFKNKKIFISIIVCLISFIVIGSIIFVLTRDKIVLAKETYTLEYGESISLKAEDYVDKDKTDKDVISKIKVSSDEKKNDKEYASLGTHTVTLKYEDETHKVKVTVKDTTKPEFDKSVEEIQITRDCNPDEAKVSEILSQFNATDLQEVTLTFNDDKVDYTKEGDYKATVKAEDASKNKSEKELNVKIVSPTITFDKSEETIYVEENFVIQATVVGKDSNITFSSSDESIATIDGQGKVTGKKAGTATVKAEANGVSAECSVTVKKAPANSTTTKKTVTNPNTGKQEEIVIVENSSVNSQPQLVREMVTYFNQERARAGQDPLTWDSDLESAVKTRAKEITTNFSHTRPDGTQGTSIAYRVTGEILHFGSTGTYDAYTAWLNSPTHREVMISKWCTKVAIARCGNYWVALFSYKV